jgi:triacylglycerol esterase/lipase EstA (alpha/beta hydrolase family)
MTCIWKVNREEFLRETKVKAEESIFSQKVIADDFVAIQVNPLEILDKVIKHRRSPLYDELCGEISVAEFPKVKSSHSPVMVEENYYIQESFENVNSDDLGENVKQSFEFSPTPKLHIYVLVHGLGGSQTDLLAFKNYISFVNPNSDFIISSKNAAKNSENDINELAENLAKEIHEDMKFHDIRSVGKISFIGFSLGGIIIRAALPLISKFKSKFHGFISLATPHLGLKLKK